MATKKRCAMMKKGSKKSRRVYTRNTEGMGMEKKMEKGKGKEKSGKNKKEMKKRKMKIMWKMER